MKKTYEQTASDMDRRFESGGFSAAGGNHQSLTFAVAAMARVLNHELLTEALAPVLQFSFEEKTRTIEGYSAVVRDYGCALGDGTALLKAVFPVSQVIGVDIRPAAVRMAKERWPMIDFEVGDIREPKKSGIIFTSHTLEHMEDPAAVVHGLLAKCKLLIAVVPPVPEDMPQEWGHIGAVPTKHWLPKLPKPYLRDSYNIVRPDGEGSHICEGNLLLIWTGRR